MSFPGRDRAHSVIVLGGVVVDNQIRRSPKAAGLRRAVDSVVMAITYMFTAADTFIRVVRRARVDIQHGNMGLDEIRTRTSGRIPSSSPTQDRRHPMATPYVERGTIPPLPMPPHQ